MNGIVALAHVAIRVKDIDRSLDFYVNTLGLEEEVLLVEPTGLGDPGGREGRHQQLMSISRERLRLGRGDRVRLAIDTRAIHLFDRQTTERIAG